MAKIYESQSQGKIQSWTTPLLYNHSYDSQACLNESMSFFDCIEALSVIVKDLLNQNLALDAVKLLFLHQVNTFIS